MQDEQLDFSYNCRDLASSFLKIRQSANIAPGRTNMAAREQTELCDIG